jgi:hypothetical protein
MLKTGNENAMDNSRTEYLSVTGEKPSLIVRRLDPLPLVRDITLNSSSSICPSSDGSQPSRSDLVTLASSPYPYAPPRCEVLIVLAFELLIESDVLRAGAHADLCCRLASLSCCKLAKRNIVLVVDFAVAATGSCSRVVR